MSKGFCVPLRHVAPVTQKQGGRVIQMRQIWVMSKALLNTLSFFKLERWALRLGPQEWEANASLLSCTKGSYLHVFLWPAISIGPWTRSDWPAPASQGLHCQLPLPTSTPWWAGESQGDFLSADNPHACALHIWDQKVSRERLQYGYWRALLRASFGMRHRNASRG